MFASRIRLVPKIFLALSFLFISSAKGMTDGWIVLASFGQGLPRATKQSSLPNKKGLIDDLAYVQERINLILQTPWPNKPMYPINFEVYLARNHISPSLPLSEFHVPKDLRADFDNDTEYLLKHRIPKYDEYDAIYDSNGQRKLSVFKIEQMLKAYASYLFGVYCLLERMIHYD